MPRSDTVDTPTIGLEEEDFVVCLETGALVDLGDLLWKKLIDSIGDARIALEYKACQIELRTDKHVSVSQLRNELLALRHEVSALLMREGLGLLSASTHPFADWRTVKARECERYRWIEQKKGDSVHRLVACGVHIHIGTFAEQRIRVERVGQYRELVPIVLAATASSPFFDGRFTGHRAYRRQLLSGLVHQTPPVFASVEDYDEYLRDLTAMGAIRQETDVWSDIRLGTAGKPTVELRCVETSSCVDDGPAVAALMQAFEFDLRTSPRSPLPSDDRRMALASASASAAAHQGAMATIWDFHSERAAPLQEVADGLFSRLKNAIDFLELWPWIEHLRERLSTEANVVGEITTESVAQPISGEMAAKFVRAEVAKTAMSPTVCWPPLEFRHLLHSN